MLTKEQLDERFSDIYDEYETMFSHLLQYSKNDSDYDIRSDKYWVLWNKIEQLWVELVPNNNTDEDMDNKWHTF